MRLPDELCSHCKRKTFVYKGEKIHCSGDCLLLDIVGRDVPLREKLSSGIRENETRNYNIVLSEYADDYKVRTDLLPQIADKRKRAIAAMLLAGLYKSEIAELLSMSLRQIVRITKYDNGLGD